MVRRPTFQPFLAILCLSGCTAISEVGDYEVDPASVVRDLNYTFIDMFPHAGDPKRPTEQSGFLDVAVVDQAKILQARARIILPPFSKNYPDEVLLMHNALTRGPQRLFFFTDSNADGKLDGSSNAVNEHVWVEDVSPDGVGKFAHSTNFIFFGPSAFTQLNGTLVLQVPMLRVPTEGTRSCLDRELGESLDVTLTMVAQDRQVGLIRRHRGTAVPDDFRLTGVLDGGSLYRIDVLIDGVVKKTFERQAPPRNDLIIMAGDWFPIDDRVLAQCSLP